MALDLGPDAGGIGLRVGRLAGPRELALRQDRDDAVVARQALRLVEELGAVAVGRLGVEPVQEQDRRAAAAVRRLDQERLAVIGEANVARSARRRARSAVESVIGRRSVPVMQ